MSDAKQFKLICKECNQTTNHLVWYQRGRDRVTRLPYLLTHFRCLECGIEHPTVEEFAREVFKVGAKEVVGMVRESADNHSNFGTE
jgi:hypothetical protein